MQNGKQFAGLQGQRRQKGPVEFEVWRVHLKFIDLIVFFLRQVMFSGLYLLN